MIKKAVSKDERAWFFSFKEKRAKTVSERIFHAGENPRVFESTDLILPFSIIYFLLDFRGGGCGAFGAPHHGRAG